ncbi:MAG: peptide chain release factor N(5)-glutamine methyltransferase [Flavobacterium sp.]|uniref:peptide chain release factor N(5)-glutamine methyltransferase n=1 Tax=Flavobacterium sp. TaxID=239 RepID=UPI0027375C20|nr:peptide chain release factor N(5)-glutamine methyltransferase [Flavobacterium sp.]MDP3681271.1 peptide chain release factor N(5)-glutamine methyltransferase [Flavobacterium sp.]MDZ4329919.1 peptide chain release factor N(5)-glutamine methyltransferase [Flavobacterium sp.]
MKNSSFKIKEYRTQFIQELTPIYDAGEAESFFYLILEEKHQLRRIDLALHPDLVFSEAEIVVWDSILEQLKQEIPVQYLLGKTSFYGLDFEVNENVLIPRPETEELVEWILSNNRIIQKSNPETSGLKILDIGTGSGCIAISLAKNIPNAAVFAIDVSEKALATAKKNAEHNAVEVTFINQNILETEDLRQQFDIIVSNPPYVRNLEKEEIKKNVLDNEPHLALFVEDNDALIFYKKIAELAQKNLSENGQLYFEINQYLGKETVDLLEKMNFKNIELRKDIYGNDRMISCHCKE